MIRPLHLPEDFETVRSLLERTSAHGEVSNRTEFRRTMGQLQRFWPLLRLLLWISPQWADMFRGFVWEEVGEPVGVVVYQRHGTSPHWTVASIGVLENHRRKGIGRRLLRTALDSIGESGGTRTALKVAARNSGAQDLFASLGFLPVSGELIFSCDPARSSNDELPAPIQIREGSPLEGQEAYELRSRITPTDAQAHFPLRREAFNAPRGARLFEVVMSRISGATRRRLLVQGENQVVIAMIDLVVSRRAGRRNELYLYLDPAAAELAAPLLSYARDQAAWANSEPVTWTLQRWQTALIKAATEAECRVENEWIWYVLEDVPKGVRG